MLKLFGDLYYIDFEVLDSFLEIEGTDYDNNILTTKHITRTIKNGDEEIEITEDENYKPKEVNGVRFEIIRNFIEDLALSSESTNEDYDEMLGSKNLQKMPTRFKLAYNTLLFYNILRKVN